MAEAVVTLRFADHDDRVWHHRFMRGPRRAKIEAQLREALAEWELPLHRYRCTVTITSCGWDYGNGPGAFHDEIPVTAEFTHRRTGAKIAITSIWLDRDGGIAQMGTQYGELTL